MEKQKSHTIYRTLSKQRDMNIIKSEGIVIKKTDVGNPEVCVAYKFHKMFNAENVETITNCCKSAGIGCVECKKRLAENMVDVMADMHTRRSKYEANPARVKEILVYGAERARKVAAKTMEEVREAMHL